MIDWLGLAITTLVQVGFILALARFEDACRTLDYRQLTEPAGTPDEVSMPQVDRAA